MRRLLFLMTLLIASISFARAQETPSERLASRAAQQEMDSSPRDGNLPSYRLAPDALEKAAHLEHVRTFVALGGAVWSLLVLWLLLETGTIARFQSLTLRYRSRFLQSYRFALLLLLATSVASLPFSIYAQAERRAYGLSVQGWGSWALDQSKEFLIAWILGGLLAWLVYQSLQRSPRWWWLRVWAIALPFALLGLLLTPYVIDPLFNRFEPLSASHPDLVQKLQAVADRGHMGITPDRMFLMHASDKSTTLNAYVTGFGPSKRVVVWDNAIAKGSTDQLLFIFGHESGHYVLNHVLWGTVEAALGALALLYLCHRLLPVVLRHRGSRWRVPGAAQWGTVAVLLLLFSVLATLTEPITMAFSRSKEHEADVYGQEAIRGLVAQPSRAAQGAFQVLGATSLDDPNPSSLVEWWTYSHPAIGRRAAFAANYHPWQPGEQPKYFNK